MSDNNALQVVLSFVLFAIGIVLVAMNSAKQDTVYFAIAAFLLAAALLLSLYVMLGTETGQVGKILTAVVMAILGLILIWIILSMPQLSIVTAAIGIFVAYFLLAHILLAIALSWGNFRLKRLP